MIDELELLEKREEYKTLLYHFMVNLLGAVRMVWNYYNPNTAISEEAEFDVQFTDAKLFETIDDKKKRYDMALEYGYKDKIEIARAELEVREEEEVFA